MSEAAQSRSALRPAAPSLLATARDAYATASRVVRDRAFLEALALLSPIVIVGVTHRVGPALWLTAVTYLAVVGVLVAGTPRPRQGVPLGWVVARALTGVAMIGMGQLLTGASSILAATYLPVVGLAAFAGTRMLVIVGTAAIACHLIVEAAGPYTFQEAGQRAAGLAAAVVLVAVGTRREVLRMQRARDRLRRALTTDRRRARQIAGVEAIGRTLSANGPTSEALDTVVDRIVREFGHRYVSVYLGHERLVRLGAQRGYTQLVDSFDGSRGVVGRVMRTRRPAFVPDVNTDPDYYAVNPGVRSEICVPLLAEGAFLGFVNVESTTTPLDPTDLRIMVAVADRLAAALIIRRERQRLSDRVELFRRLREFGEAINGALDPDRLYDAVVRAVPTVVASDLTALVTLDRSSGRYFLRAIAGIDGVDLGAEIRPGEGISGRAIRDRVLVVDEQFTHASLPASVAAAFRPDMAPMQAAAVPFVRDGAVVGALAVLRFDGDHRFSELDRDALAMLAEQATLAVTNAFLHADVADLAMRDPLTGLSNRRYLDPALEQLFARWSRTPEAERAPLAAIMFDLDHFSDLNNIHGHQIGDEVLRTFGAILRGRMRSTDLVGRVGGEEFVAVMYRATLDDAMRLADEIRAQLAASPVVGADGTPVTATVSAGCSAVGSGAAAPEDLLRAADVALYMAKRSGRDRVCAA